MLSVTLGQYTESHPAIRTHRTSVNIGCGSQTRFYQDYSPGLQYPRVMICPYRSLSVLNNLRQLPLDCAHQTVWYSPVGYELNRISMFKGLSVYYLVQDIQGSQGGTSLECGVLGVSPCSSWGCRATHCRLLPTRTLVMGHEKITAPTTEQTIWHTR